MITMGNYEERVFLEFVFALGIISLTGRTIDTLASDVADASSMYHQIAEFTLLTCHPY